MRSLRRAAPWLAVAAALAVAPTASAQSADAPPEAIERYRQAREHFESGAYPEAAAALEEALRHDPDSPTLVYNLARVYELMGELDRALEQYERYQLLLPQQQAREQEQADATIRRLEGARANRLPEAAPPPPQQVAPLRQLPGTVLVRERGVADDAFWAAVLVAAGSFVAAGALGAVALWSSSTADGFVLEGDANPNDRDVLQRQAAGFGIATDIALGLGGVGVVTAALLYFLREHTVERAPIGAGEDTAALDTVDVAPWASPSGFGLILRGAL